MSCKLTNLKNDFSLICKQIAKEHERCLIKKHNTPIAALVSLADLKILEKQNNTKLTKEKGSRRDAKKSREKLDDVGLVLEEQKNILTMKEAAAYLNISISNLTRKINDGNIKVIRIRNAIRITREEIERYQNDMLQEAKHNLRVEEAAKLLGISVYTVRRANYDGKINCSKPGKEYLIPHN